MGVQKNIKKLQEQNEILGGALTNAFKEIESLKTLTQGTLTAFQLHIGKDEWVKLVDKLKDLENVEQQLEKGNGLS
tara:strand:- start:266 stop:493 length:228 start_codon:yes stop_codon:yes gene_type:complete